MLPNQSKEGENMLVDQLQPLDAGAVLANRYRLERFLEHKNGSNMYRATDTARLHCPHSQHRVTPGDLYPAERHVDDEAHTNGMYGIDARKRHDPVDAVTLEQTPAPLLTTDGHFQRGHCHPINY